MTSQGLGSPISTLSLLTMDTVLWPAAHPPTAPAFPHVTLKLQPQINPSSSLKLRLWGILSVRKVADRTSQRVVRPSAPVLSQPLGVCLFNRGSAQASVLVPAEWVLSPQINSNICWLLGSQRKTRPSDLSAFLLTDWCPASHSEELARTPSSCQGADFLRPARFLSNCFFGSCC